MKKDIKALIKRLTLLVQFKKTGKCWVGVDGNGKCNVYNVPPIFWPSGESESLDHWVAQKGNGSWGCSLLSTLDNLPLSMVCPSLTSKTALFYTDGETVWLIDM